MTIVTPLLGHTSEETAYVVDDYPYGFTLRCKIRYWIEHHERHGFRFCSQTTNPKRSVESWNKPKKGTYIKIAAGMYLNEDGHVKCTSLSEYSDWAESKAFFEKAGHTLNSEALDNLSLWIKMKEVYEAKLNEGLSMQESAIAARVQVKGA